MYSKYKEIKVILEILQEYGILVNERYLYSTEKLQELISKASKSIYDVPTPEKIQQLIRSMEFNSEEYDKLVLLINEINEILLLYKHSFTKDNLTNIFPLKTEEELAYKFHEIEKRDYYIKILTEIAYDLWLSADEIILENLDGDYKLNLNNLYDMDEIEHKELIYYNIMFKYLYIHPEFNKEKGKQMTL